jgi:hypothetical protein
MHTLRDGRERKEYDTAELITACLMMFLLKEGSRNAMNNECKEVKFINNYFRLFKMGLPHMDTVEDFLRILVREWLVMMMIIVENVYIKPTKVEIQYIFTTYWRPNW